MLSVTDFVPKGIISGVRVQAGLYLDMLDADRSPNMQSAFLPELHRWISKLTARHLHACPPGDLLITMVKETVILYKKEYRKMKKTRISPWSERNENAKWLRDCLWLCQACKRGFTCRPMWRNLRQEAHSYPQADICSAPLQLPAWHTSNNRLWSPLAYGLGGNNSLFPAHQSQTGFLRLVSWEQRTMMTTQSGSLKSCWIAVPTCPVTFDLIDLRPVAMITGRITFLRPAATCTATGRTAQSCTRFSDQNVNVTSRSMWECVISLDRTLPHEYLGCNDFLTKVAMV